MESKYKLTPEEEKYRDRFLRKSTASKTTYRLSVTVLEDIKRLSNISGVTQGGIVERAVREMVARQEISPPPEKKSAPPPAVGAHPEESMQLAQITDLLRATYRQTQVLTEALNHISNCAGIVEGFAPAILRPNPAVAGAVNYIDERALERIVDL